jgi:hypothetical protein
MYFYPMQVYANSNKLSLKTIFLFIAVVLIAFLPVSSFLFFVKNDAFVGYFPPKFFMSESIHAGYLPLWNPYINFGFPQYGDMSGGYWSPFTWLIASTVGYNAYTFTIEILCYILIGGIGMYQLTSTWQLDKKVRLIAGITFMCCGYNVGHLQHFNWLSGAAFLPWCLWSYLLLLSHFSLRNILLSVLFFYLLVASAHPGISIGAFYFFCSVFFFHLLKKDNIVSLNNRIKKLCISHAIFGVLFLLLSAGMIVGYLDILPYFVRGEKISLADSLLYPANIKTWVSALLPFATVKNDAFYNTDPSMRNSYFSLTLLLFFLLACVNRKNSWQKYLLITGIVFALLSAGGIFKIFAYKSIPLIGYVRLNGEFRIFTLLCFIIVAAIELNKFINNKNTFTGNTKWIYYIAEILLFLCIISGLYNAIKTKYGLLYDLNNIFQQDTLSLKLKALIDAVSFYDTLWIQGIIQLFILWVIKYCLKFGNFNLLKQVVVADIIIASLLNIPFTGVGKASVAQVQKILDQSPNGIPLPVLQPIKNIDTITTEKKLMIGDWSMYNKQIGVKSEVSYPIILKNMSAYFNNNEQNPDSNFLQYPFVFINDAKKNSTITIENFSPNKIVLNVTTESLSQLILQQNYYPHWFYYTNKEKKKVEKAAVNFMSAPISKDTHTITFSFEPAKIKWAMLLSAIFFVTYCLLLFVLLFKQPYPSSPKK